MSAEIGGQLSCKGAQLKATKGFALNAEGAQIKGGLFFRGLKRPTRFVCFINVQTGTLADDPACWPVGAYRSLDGFTYYQIATDTDAKRRIEWLENGSYAYAVDVVIPIIDIGQTSAWAPSTTRGPWGYRLWWFKGFLSVFGWIVTALGAAAITGIIRRD